MTLFDDVNGTGEFSTFGDEADGAVCAARLVEILTEVRLSVGLLAELRFSVATLSLPR